MCTSCSEGREGALVSSFGRMKVVSANLAKTMAQRAKEKRPSNVRDEKAAPARGNSLELDTQHILESNH